MPRFKQCLVVVSLCAAMLAGAGKNAALQRHSRATLEDDLLTTIINVITDLESRVSIPPG